MRPLDEIRAKAMATWRPPPRIPLSEFIENRLYLPAGLSSVPGKIRLWSFQRGLADILVSDIERVTIIKGSRLGFSTLLVAAIGHYIVNDPSSVLCVLPTSDDARNFMVSQVEAVFQNSPILKDAIHQPTPGSLNFDTMLHRRCQYGASLRVISARAPRHLRAHSARVLVVDEADGCEQTAEGNPLSLAERRTQSFSDRRIIIGSTPTDAETSHVNALYEQSDQRIFEVPCPHCGEFNEITWANIVWKTDKPETAEYCCPHCGGLTPDSGKFAMVESGRWRITNPDVLNHAGFRINCLVAPHAPASWPALAQEFVQAKRRGADELRVFVNTTLGQVFSNDDPEGPQPHELQTLAEDFSLEKIPARVLYIAAAVDVQVDRLEIVTMGFDREDCWYWLDYTVLYGPPTKDEVWIELTELLQSRFPHPLGGTISRDATAIDSGDGNVTKRVLDYCAAHRELRCIPIKGAAGSRPALARAQSKRARGLHIVGVDALKTRLFDRLATKTGIKFSNTLVGAFYEQLLSERVTIKYSRGQPRRQFTRYPGRLAEALDATIYALAVRQIVNTPIPRREAELSGRPIAPPIPTTIPSAWLHGR